MPDDHSDLVPLLPIPNRTVKRVSADDSADSRVKVGHRQAITVKSPTRYGGAFFIGFRNEDFTTRLILLWLNTRLTRQCRLLEMH